MSSERPTFKILQGNSLEIMQGMEPGSVDCVITDPPYLGFGFHRGIQRYWNSFAPYYKEMRRLAGPDRRIAISQPEGRIDKFSENLPPTKKVVVEDGFADNRGHAAAFLLMNPMSDMAQEAEDWPADIVPESIHPNDRNVNKMAILVKAMSKPGDTILDPFCGSGAIGVAAVLLGRSYIGIELMEDRAEDARKRLEVAVEKFVP